MSGRYDINADVKPHLDRARQLRSLIRINASSLSKQDVETSLTALQITDEQDKARMRAFYARERSKPLDLDGYKLAAILATIVVAALYVWAFISGWFVL